MARRSVGLLSRLWSLLDYLTRIIRKVLMAAGSWIAAAVAPFRRWAWGRVRWLVGLLTAPPGAVTAGPCGGAAGDLRPECRRYPGVTAAVVVLLAAWVVLQQVDAVLEGMRVTGAQGYGVDRALRDLPAAIDTWQTWHAGNERLVAPGLIVAVHVLVDTLVFVPALTTFLAFVLLTMVDRLRPSWARSKSRVAARYLERLAEIRRENREIAAANRRRRFRSESENALRPPGERRGPPPDDPLVPEPPRPDAGSISAYSAKWAKAFRWTAPLLVVFAVADVSENVLFGLSYAAAWEWAAGPLGALTLLKWLSVGLLVLTVVYIRLASQPAESRLDGRGLGDDARAFFRGLVAMRVPLLIFVLLAVALVFGLLDQIPDAVRRWSVVELAAAFYFVAGLSVALWLFGLWVYRRVTERVGRYDVHAPEAQRLRRRVAWTLVLGALAQVAVWWAVPGRIGLGLVVPGVIVVIFFVTSAALPTPEPSPQPPPPRWPKRIIPHYLPRFLAAATLGALGLAALNAAIPTMVVKRESPSLVGVIGNIVLPILLIVVLVAAMAVAVVVTLRADPQRPRGGFFSKRIERARAGTVLLAVAVVPPVVLWGLWALGLGDELRALPAISTNWLLLAAAVGLAAAPAAFYLYDPEYFPLQWGGGWFAGLKEFAFDTADGDLRWSREARRLGLVAAVIYVSMGVWLVWKPLEAAPLLGTVGVGGLWVTSFAAVALLASIFAERTRPPRMLRYLRLDRTPVFALLLVWVLAAQAPGLRQESYHDVRVADDAEITATVAAGFRQPFPAVGDLCGEELPEGQQRIDVEDAFCRWLDGHGLLGPGASGAVPIVFVSAWGGGIRAGAWTALAMDCIFEPDGYVEVPARVDGKPVDLCSREGTGDPYEFSDSLFAVSGISGGSLGFSQYAALLSGKEAYDIDRRWVRSAFGEDFLAPTTSQLMFVDIPLSLLGYLDGPLDRAAVTERAWEQAWLEASNAEESLLAQGLFESWRVNRHVPLLILNGTSHTDSCRFNTSVLDVGVESVDVGPDSTPFVFDDCTSLDAFEAGYSPPSPTDPPVPPESWAFAQTRDLADFLCDGEDVRLSTAALLSARFPAVSPPGRIDRCPDDGVGEQAYVTDGGNLELSGTLTAYQIWAAVAPMIDAYNRELDGAACVVPFMVHLENGYQPPGPQTLEPALPNEWLAPARSNARGGLVKNARINAALPFDDPLPGVPAGEVKIGEDKVRTLPYEVDHYAFLTTRAHPGVQAPFGWALSEQAIEDLEVQLFENAAELAEIRAWFSGDLSCG